jgi:tetratricopeptide (TPR) repeat protein
MIITRARASSCLSRPRHSSILARVNVLRGVSSVVLVAVLAHAAPSGAGDAPLADVLDLAGRAAAWKAGHGKAEAVVAVLGLVDRWDDAPPAALAAFLDACADDGAAQPLARAQAIFAAAQVALRRGDAAAVVRRQSELGLVADPQVSAWRIIGPFGFDGGDLIGTAYGPEAGEHPEEAGKRGPVTWRQVPASWQRLGVVPLGDLLRPDAQAAAYALTYVWSDAPREVALRVGSTGAIRVWAAGRLVIDRRLRSRPLGLDQDAGGVHLDQGWSAILVKVAVEEGAWSFRLRVTAPDGRTLPLKIAAAPPAGTTVAWPVPPPPPVVEGQRPARPARAVKVARLGALLAARARHGNQAAGRDLAVYLATVSPEDPDGRPVEVALRAAGAEGPRAEPATLLVAARYSEDADHRRAAAERLLGSASAAPRLRAEAGLLLARHYREEANVLSRARAALDEAIRLDPTYWPASLARLELAYDLGLREVALVALRSLVDALPEVPGPLRSLARLEGQAGRPAVAAAAYAKLAAADRKDLGARARLAQLASDRGDTTVWLAALAEQVNLEPTSTRLALDLGEARAGQGDVDGALAAYDAALEACPDDDRLLEAAGRLLVERGGARRKDLGLARLKRALVMRPGNPDLRAYLARVAPDSGDDLEKQYARNVPALMKTYRNFGKQESVVVLLDAKVTRVHQNGQSETWVQRVVRVQDETAASDEREQSVSYSPQTQTVELRAARVYKPSGQIIEARNQGEREVSEPWYGLYYDVREDVVQFEKVESGDVIEYAYLLSDSGGRNLLADYYGDLHFLGESAPRAEVEYTLIAPRDRHFSWHVPELARLVRKDEDLPHGEHRTRLTATRVAKIEPDDSMPGWTEAAPYVHVSTYGSWQEVASWYWRLVEPQLVADDNVRKAALAAIKGKKTERDKVRAIYDLVLKSTRYVGLEFGINSFKPYRVPLIFERKFGDCKDKASLIVVMLREVGVPAQLVLVRTRRNGDLADSPASLAIFDHAIAYVPSLDLYLDGTAEFSGSEELPASDQGVQVLRVSPPAGPGLEATGLFTRTPVFPADDNLTERRTTIELGSKGEASLSDEVTVHGAGAAAWRQHYQTPDERLGRYEKSWNAAVPGIKIDKVSFGPLEDHELPVTARASGRVSQLGTAVPGRLNVPVMGRESELTRSYGRTSKRHFDLIVDFPWLNDDRISFVLPAGARLSSLPVGGHESGPFGAVDLEVTTSTRGERTVVEVHARARLAARRVTPADYPAFRTFLGEADALLGQSIVVELAP